jgi:hypothetical protein
MFASQLCNITIVKSPRDVLYGDINLQECMYSLPTILHWSGRYSGQREHTFLQIYIPIWYISRRFDNSCPVEGEYKNISRVGQRKKSPSARVVNPRVIFYYYRLYKIAGHYVIQFYDVISSTNRSKRQHLFVYIFHISSVMRREEYRQENHFKKHSGQLIKTWILRENFNLSRLKNLAK